MFDVLPESAAPRAPLAWGSRVASLAVHAAVIAGALRLTDGEAQPPVRLTPTDTNLYIVPDATRHSPSPPPAPPAPRPGPVTVPVPVFVDVPPDLPPVGTSPVSFAVTGWDSLAAGRDSLAGPGSGLLTGAAIDARLADEPPVLISHPPLRYPEVMRQAGVEGRVVIEAVLDTAGRVERGSLRTVLGAHQLFNSAARDVVAGSRYRPARVGGRAVRVRIHVPVAFALQR